MEANDPAGLIAALEEHRRPCWKPVTEERDGPADASKFGGLPLIPEGEEWPACPNCGLPMQFFVQLNAGELPAGAGQPFGPGLLQLFYCTTSDPHCEGECNAWSPGSKSVLARVVDATRPGRAPVESPEAQPFPPRRITGWEEGVDHPSFEEATGLGVEFPTEQWEALPDEYVAVVGDKLGGWPAWLQAVEYPACPECGRRMEAVFQVDSEVNVPYMFGDMGIGHISQCPEHRERLAFGWACT